MQWKDNCLADKQLIFRIPKERIYFFSTLWRPALSDRSVLQLHVKINFSHR